MAKSWITLLAFVLLGGPGHPAPARAQDASCVALCGAACIKPWAIPDRWDDGTGIAGYMGEGGRRAPDWRNNGQWDREAFVDANDSGLYELGEPFTDANANARFDAELYDPAATGYVASPGGDLGRELVLHSGAASSRPETGAYLAFQLPALNKGTPVPGAEAYRENIAACNPSIVESGDVLLLTAGAMVGPTNQGMHELIARDPVASWDATSGTVQNSGYTLSPRVLFLPVYDPRKFAQGTPGIAVTKVVAFFMEQMIGPAEVRGRLLQATVPAEHVGPQCEGIPVGGFLLDCPVPARPASWGRLKASYR